MAQFAPQYNLLRIIERLRLGITVIFWIIFLLSVIPALIKILEINLYIDDLLNTFNIVSILLFFVLEIIVNYILNPQAESKRRDDFLDNSFGSSFSPTPSVGYFDTNEIPFGLYKTACNLFENSFFTYTLLKAITIRKTVLPVFALISIVVFAYHGFKYTPIALSILQAFFSAALLGGLAKHFILLVRLNIIYEAWISLFQHPDLKSDTKKYEALVYRNWLQYEALHSTIPAEIPDRVFKNLNTKLTREWDLMKIRYKIN